MMDGYVQNGGNVEKTRDGGVCRDTHTGRL